MKKRLIELQQKRAELSEKLEALLAVEDRNFTDAEQAEFDARMLDLDTLDAEIEQEARKVEARLRVAANRAPKQSPEQKATQRYSILKAIRQRVNGQPLDGIEKEMHDEAVREARESGQSISGIGVPGFVKRDVEITGGTSGASNAVATDLGDMIPFLRPKLIIEDLGATMLTGLTGNLDLPRGKTLASAAWATEKATATETEPVLDKLSLSPNRLAAFTDVTMQAIIQSTPDMERLVRNELQNATARKVDQAAINGSGSGEPEGILNNSAISLLAIGANGGPLTRDLLIDMIGQISADNADMGTLKFATTPLVRAALQKLATDAGSGLFVWGMQADSLLGYDAKVSTLMPSDLDKGTSTGVCHSIIYGDWSQLICASWAGYDLIVNPYTKSKEGTIEVVVNSFWDIGVKQPDAFSAYADITVS